MTRRALNSVDKIDITLTGFLSSLTRYLVLIFTIIAVLNQFGVQTASLIAILGAAGLAIGLAMQGTLSNICLYFALSRSAITLKYQVNPVRYRQSICS